MTTTIAQIIAGPVAFSHRQIIVEGVCRTTCENPFPHFTVEDRTGTIICQSMNGLPRIGSHIQVTGDFVVDIPTACSFAVPRLNETHRAYLANHKECSFVGCEFEAVKPAVAA